MGHSFEELSSKVLAIAVEVHKALGPGFVEPIYQKAMEVALTHRSILYVQQKEIHVYFEEVDVGFQRLDLIVSDEIILELKAVKAFEDIHLAQLRSYLKATGLHVGLLLNFNATTLSIKRVVLRAWFRAFVPSCFRDSVQSILVPVDARPRTRYSMTLFSCFRTFVFS